MENCKVHKNYYFPITSTMEHLDSDMNPCYDSMVQYGDKVIIAVTNYKGEVITAIYEFVETAEETGLCSIECRLNLAELSPKTFADTGHAIAWGLKRK